MDTIQLAKKGRIEFTKRMWGVAAAFLLKFRFLLFGNHGMADSMRGFFSDIKEWNGTVTGTQYKNASNEIDVTADDAVSDGDMTTIPITVTIKNPVLK